MYLDFFDLKEQPFRMTPDPRFLYLGRAHSRAMAYMEYSVWNRDSFVLITGEIGSGKTTLIQRLLRTLDDRVIVGRIYHTKLDELEFLQALLLEFGFEPFGRSKVDLLDTLNTFLLDHYSRGNRVVLVVDEAQNLSSPVLEEIRLLSGLETERDKLLNVVLVGQPELNDILSHRSMEQLRQRIRLRFHIRPLDEAETEEYINHRIRVAGSEPDCIFDQDIYGAAYRYSKGIPRLINTFCDTALLCAFADGSARVTTREIEEAFTELQWDENSTKNDSSTGTDINIHDEFQKLYNEITRELVQMEARLKKLSGDLGE